MTPLAYAPSARSDRPPAPDDLCVAVLDRGVLLAPAGPADVAPVIVPSAAADGFRLPVVADMPDAVDLAPIGTLDGRPAWAVALASIPDGLQRLDWLTCTALPDDGLRGVVARAVQVASWRATHRFCGRCAAPLADLADMVARRCGSCGLVEFAQAQTVALVAVWRDGPTRRREVLLARHTYGASHLWALVGGYVDPAETLEHAARREVAEEVGLDVVDLRYFGSEAWGFHGPQTMIVAFTARAADPSAVPTVDDHELAEARFFPVDALPDPIPPSQLLAARVLSHLAASP